MGVACPRVVVEVAMDEDFGISLDPSSVAQRHAFYDSDEEEEAAAASTPTFCVKPAQACSKADVLIFAFGEVASVFVQSYFCLEPLCTVAADSPTALKDSYFAKQRKALQEDAESTVISKIFTVETNSEHRRCLVCIHEKPLKLELVNLWTVKVFETFTASDVLVLCSLPLHQHLSSHHSEEEQVLLRALQTTKWTLPPVATFLEPANSLSEEPAAVLTHCQVQAIAGSIAALYSASSVVLVEGVAALRPLLLHPLLAENLKINPEEDACRLVKRYLPKPKTELNTLYT